MRIPRIVGSFVAAVSVVVSSFVAVAPAKAGAQVDQVVAQKANYVATLTPYQSCITKKGSLDAYSPLFYGCVDWHSAVHAHWSLYAGTALTGNQTYANQANTSLKSSLIAAELAYMKKTSVMRLSDNPYGFAWLLRLARERQQLSGDTSLRPLADYAAAEAVKSTRADVTSSEYANASFVAIQLWEWAAFTGNTAMADQVRAYVDAKIRPWSCSLASDANVTGFFPPCAMRMAAIATVDGPAASTWVNAQAQGYVAAYRISFPTLHSKALNFTTAYALARAGKVAGNSALVENAASLVNAQMPARSVYAGAYDQYHWIPQMGMLAIQTIVV